MNQTNSNREKFVRRQLQPPQLSAIPVLLSNANGREQSAANSGRALVEEASAHRNRSQSQTEAAGSMPGYEASATVATVALQPLAVSVTTAARLLGVGKTTVWSLIKQRKVEVMRIGRRTNVRVASLVAFVAERSPD